MSLEFLEESVEVGDLRIAVAISNLANGSLILVSDGEPRFGTIAVGVPSPFSETSPVATSCVVGTRFQAETRAIADIAAQRLGGIVVVNLYLSRENEGEVGAVLSAVRSVMLEMTPMEKGKTRLG
ncbi:MAG: hypothetical protein ACXADB_02660 [Candidatus Hermodarchaeia archaeon]